MNRALFFSISVVIAFCCLHAYWIPLLGEEMRYASVAWRMFIEHRWFLPYWGHLVYLQKTPLLFWCLNLGWWINLHWPWPVIFPLIFAIFAVVYTQKLAQALFPEQPAIPILAPLVLVSMPFFITYLPLLRFDMMLTLFNVMACYFLIGKKYGRFALANGLGLLAKGPVIYVFTVPEFFLFCFYLSAHPKKELAKGFFSILISLSALLIWWGPIIYQGKFYLISNMLYEQVFARVTGSKGVVKPLWDYLPLLPCFFLPWILFPSFFRVKIKNQDTHRKSLAIIQLFSLCFILFSLIQTKESRYLLPLTPLVAIYIASRLERLNKRVILLMLLSILSTVTIDLSLSYMRLKTQNFQPAVNFISDLLEKNIPVVSRDPAMSDMQFAGRWKLPLAIAAGEKNFNAWLRKYPQGWVMTSRAQKTSKAYVLIKEGCFEQSYSHLHRVLQICPASRFLVVSENKINVP